MPVVKKAQSTGNPVADYLYGSEDVIFPQPFGGAVGITREPLIRAIKEALPPLKEIAGSLRNIDLRNLAERLVSVIPKKHIAPIRSVEVVAPKALPDTAGNITFFVSGEYLPDLRTIILYKNLAHPSTVAHEIRHDVFHYANPRYIKEVMQYYMSRPLSEIRDLQKLNPTSALLSDPAELFAEIYANKMLQQATGARSNLFLEALPPQLSNLPYRIKPFNMLYY